MGANMQLYKSLGFYPRTTVCGRELNQIENMRGIMLTVLVFAMFIYDTSAVPSPAEAEGWAAGAASVDAGAAVAGEARQGKSLTSESTTPRGSRCVPDKNGCGCCRSWLCSWWCGE